jgi:ABC-type bacteriocin/lantibiotic exporter with double-glycine peptidase domain
MQLMSLSSTATAPFELVACTFFLYNLLGWTAIAGLSVMVITLPLNQFFVKRRIRIHREVLASRDHRQEVLGEFVQAIRFVKISALEEKWLGRVYAARDTELSWLLKTRMNYLGINVRISKLSRIEPSC